MKNHGIVIQEPSGGGGSEGSSWKLWSPGRWRRGKADVGTNSCRSLPSVRWRTGDLRFWCNPGNAALFYSPDTKRFSVIHFRARIITAVPSGITQVERRAVKEQPINRSKSFSDQRTDGRGRNRASGDRGKWRMIVDIGGGTTEVAVIFWRESFTVTRHGWRRPYGWYDRQVHQTSMLIGERTARNQINVALHSSRGSRGPEVRGRDLVTGVLKPNSQWRRSPWGIDHVCRIIKTVRNALESTPPNWRRTLLIMESCLLGGSLLSGLDELLDQVGLPFSMRKIRSPASQ